MASKKAKVEKPRPPTMGDVVPNGSHSHLAYPSPAGPVWLWGSRARLFFDAAGCVTDYAAGQRVWWISSITSKGISDQIAASKRPPYTPPIRRYGLTTRFAARNAPIVA